MINLPSHDQIPSFNFLQLALCMEFVSCATSVTKGMSLLDFSGDVQSIML